MHMCMNEYLYQSDIWRLWQLQDPVGHSEMVEAFDYTLPYRSGSKNVKPEELSCHFVVDQPDSEPKSILPSFCIVGAATWQVEKQVHEALHSTTDQEARRQTPCLGYQPLLFHHQEEKAAVPSVQASLCHCKRL